MEHCRVLPLPTTYLQRTRFGEIMYQFVYPKRKFKNIDGFYEVDVNGTFATESLHSLNDTLYRSLSLIVFGTEEHYQDLHKAVDMNNNDKVSDKFQAAQLENELQNIVSKYNNSKNCQHIPRQAPITDVFMVAHLFQIPIILFIESDEIILKVVLPDGTKNDDCSFYKHEHAIHLALETTCRIGSIIFKPVKSFQRVKTLNDSKDGVINVYESNTMISNEQNEQQVSKSLNARYSVILMEKRGLKCISIPFVKVRDISPNLAESCGSILETKLSFSCLELLKRYFLNPKEIQQIKLDSTLYEFARRWSIDDIAEQMERLAEESSLTHILEFIGNIQLNSNSLLFRILCNSLYWATLDELKITRIPLTSKAHSLVNEFLTELIIGREDMQRILPRYKLPHILLCLDTNAECFGKYYNGAYWCNIYVSSSLKEIIPYLKSNKYCVQGDRLFFIKDSNTLGEVKLLNDYEGQIQYSPIPPGVDDIRISTTTKQDTILLLSNESDRKIAEVQKSPEGETTISSWKTIDLENYSFTFLEDIGIIYHIDQYRLALKTETKNDLKDVIASLESNQPDGVDVFYYELFKDAPLDEYQKGLFFHLINIPIRGSGVYLAVPRTDMVEHLTKLNI